MKKKVWVTIVIIVATIAALIIYSAASGNEKEIVLETQVEKGRFEITVMVTGELQAMQETEISGPQALRSRSLRIHTVKIQKLIAEGTVVDSGDWVATLDRSEADNSLKDIMDDLEQRQSNLLRTELDTTMSLRQLRDELINLNFNMEETEITLEQSKYEPPATIRQAEISLQKATRAYKQAGKNYKLKVQQSKADMREAEINLSKVQRRHDEMTSVLKEFDIKAPAPGMVIYRRGWNGQKRTEGSEINPWDMTVATLPDLSTMISKTYVNEIDISKVKINQSVKVGVDAFPEKEFSGTVYEVANIGEQLPNTDAKVFEVRIELNEKDTILRPSMTTSNSVITQVFEDVLYVPLEAVRANDSLTFVYTKTRERRVVVLGESNENFIIVELGLKKGEKLYLSSPEDPESFKITGLELMDIIKQKEGEKKMEIKEKKGGEKEQRRPQQGQSGGERKRAQQ
jgi:HlyD family secretion protein